MKWFSKPGFVGISLQDTLRMSIFEKKTKLCWPNGDGDSKMETCNIYPP